MITYSSDGILVIFNCSFLIRHKVLLAPTFHAFTFAIITHPSTWVSLVSSLLTLLLYFATIICSSVNLQLRTASRTSIKWPKLAAPLTCHSAPPFALLYDLINTKLLAEIWGFLVGSKNEPSAFPSTYSGGFREAVFSSVSHPSMWQTYRRR